MKKKKDCKICPILDKIGPSWTNIWECRKCGKLYPPPRDPNEAIVLQTEIIKPDFCITFVKIGDKIRCGVDAPGVEYAFDLKFLPPTLITHK